MSLTEEIISEVLDRPPLWNSKHNDHKNRRIINKLWEEIKEKLNVEVGELKKKWKNLRDNYRKELKKIPLPRSGDAASDYKPTWQYFDQMSFLRDEVLPANSDSNIHFDDSSAQTGNEAETPPSHDDSREEYFDSSPRMATNSTNNTTNNIDGDDTSSTQQSTNITLTDHQGGASTSTTAAVPRKRKTANDIRAEFLELEKKRIALLEKDISQTKETSQTENKSDDYYFLMSLLPQMESFTGIKKFRVRQRINQVIMEELYTPMYSQNNMENVYNTGYQTTYGYQNQHSE